MIENSAAKEPQLYVNGFFPCYGLEVIAHKLDVVALYNDWPTHKSASATDAVSTSTRLNEMTLEEPNVVRVLARPLGETIPKEAFVQVHLFRMLAEDQILSVFRHSWMGPAIRPLVVGEHTELCRHEISWARTFGRWEWENGRPYMLEDRPQILELVARIRSALERKDFDTYAELHRLKVEEISRATGKDAASVLNGQTLLLKELGKFDDWTLTPYDPDKLSLESCCGGRLVEVFAGDGRRHLFRGLLAGGDLTAFTLTVGRVNGVWTAVR